MATESQSAAKPSTQGRNAKDVVPSGQLVTFRLDDVEFGFDIDRVREITTRSRITPVPGSPSFVLGVINLRGLIVPVLDSRLRFHLAPQEPTGRTRIIVLDLAGQLTGLQVDAVSEVVRLEDFTLRETPPLVAGVRSDYLAGMVTLGQRLITLIDLDKILDSQEFEQRERLLERNSTVHNFSSEIVQEQVELDQPYVTFALGGESFGINLEMVEEILELPAVTKVPDAPDYVMGVICLRDQVLPLLDLTQLVSVESQGELAPREMVLLLSFGEARIGVAVNAIQEIIRVKEDDILPAPDTLSEDEAARLEGVVLRSDRMVSLLRVLEVIGGEDRDKIAAMGTSLSSHQGKETVVESHDLPLVVFRLGEESFSLHLHEVQEIIMVGLITPVPRAPSFIEGVLNLRGEVMPVLDLRDRFGLDRQARTSQSRIIISTIAGVNTGLVVDAVEEVKNVDSRRLEAPPRVMAAGANAYITHVVRTETGMVFLLDIQHLLTDSEGRQMNTFRQRKRADA
ncbi:MAG: chemotaxis protein CheW [Firmicutes bacterium]|nr:chemotaxis protein CheW [Bacillota bacterium]